MRSKDEQQIAGDATTYRELQLLSEVEEAPEVTQRELSHRIGIALGLTNVLMRNLVQKGYVRATQAGWKRWLYNLTPEGFSQKIRLTIVYVHRFIDHYQRVRRTLRQQLEPLALHEESTIAIYGTGEFAELVYLGLKDYGIEEIDVFGPAHGDSRRFLGMPIRDVAELQPDTYDRVVIGFLGGSARVRAELRRRGVAEDRLVVFFAEDKGKEEV